MANSAYERMVAGNDSMDLESTIKGHQKQFLAHKFDDPDEVSKFKGRSHLPKHTRRENTHRRVCRKYIDSGCAEWLKCLEHLPRNHEALSSNPTKEEIKEYRAK
jgi:hypothetical protein